MKTARRGFEDALKVSRVDVVEVKKVIEKRVYKTVLDVPLTAALVDGVIMYATYGDWEIVWPMYDHYPTIKQEKFNKSLYQMVREDLQPLRDELYEKFLLIQRNRKIMSDEVNHIEERHLRVV